MKKIFAIVGLSSMCLIAGCGGRATIASGGYNHYFAKYGEYNLVSKNSDLYMEKVDGSKSKRLTFTPKFKEDFAFIIGNSGYIAYSVYETTSKMNLSKPNKYYIQNMDMGPRSRKSISEKEFNNYLLDN